MRARLWAALLDVAVALNTLTERFFVWTWKHRADADGDEREWERKV